MKILQKEFSSKSFEVKASNKNMRKAYKMQLVMAKAGDIEGKEPVLQIQQALDVTDQLIDFISSVLKLDDDQLEKLDDLESEKTIKIANHIILRLMGLTDQQIKESEEEQKKEEKK